MQLSITEASKNDLQPLGELYQQLMPNVFSIEKMERVLAENRHNNKHTVLVAKDNGRLVGTVLATICEMLFGQCRGFMVIEDLVVDKNARRMGVGTLLMQSIEIFARQLDCAYIMLITDKARLDAQGFYRNLGYSTDEYCAFKKHL